MSIREQPVNRTCLLFFSWCNQCSWSVLISSTFCTSTTSSFSYPPPEPRRYFFLQSCFKWPRRVRIAYLWPYIDIHSICQKQHEIIQCLVRWDVQQQTVRPRGVVSTATGADLFRQITSSDFQFFQTRWLVLMFRTSFCFCSPNRGVIPLKSSCLTAFFALITGRRRRG